MRGHRSTGASPSNSPQEFDKGLLSVNRFNMLPLGISILPLNTADRIKASSGQDTEITLTINCTFCHEPIPVVFLGG